MAEDVSRTGRDGATTRDDDAVADGPATWRTLRLGTGPEWSGHQLALMGVSTLGVLVFLACLDRASVTAAAGGPGGGLPSGYWLFALGGPAVAWVAGSGAAAVLWAGLLLVWFVTVPAGSFSWWSVPAGVGVLVAHAAVALSATAPPVADFPRRVLRRWVRVAGLAALAAPATGLLASLVAGRGLPANPVAWAGGLLGVVVGLWLLRQSPPRPRA